MNYRVVCIDCSFTQDISEDSVMSDDYNKDCPICGGLMNLEKWEDPKTKLNFFIHTYELQEHYDFMKMKFKITDEVLFDWKCDIYRLPDKVLFDKLTKKETV